MTDVSGKNPYRPGVGMRPQYLAGRAAPLRRLATILINCKAGPAFGRQNQRAKSRLPDERSEPAQARPFQLCDRRHHLCFGRLALLSPIKRTILAVQGRSETLIDTGLDYRPGDPVRVRVVRREQRISVTDDGAAIAKAGRPHAWREAAEVVGELGVNVSRRGVVSLPVVPVGPCEEKTVRRIGEASLCLYQAMLEREECASGGGVERAL
jgi:hypothetical protein